MPIRLSDIPDPQVLALVEQCRLKTARSFTGADGQRHALPMLKRSHAPRVDVSRVEGKPGRFLIHFLGTRGKTPLVSFEAGKFGGSVGVTLILDNRGAAV